MGYQKDQLLNLPPPLPPREPPPPSYDAAVSGYHSQPLTYSWSEQDPRSTSAESLIPRDSQDHGRRTLLLIYIHGFMGNETSFQSFPAHIHNLTTSLLTGSHVVHTKIYPRYKSRKAIEYARDDFSNWLCPHESPTTDVILLGHSMGGILAAEVALLPPYSPTSRDPFRHRILGTVNFDTPFLGMHPGVVVSGIGSLFRPSPETPSARYKSGIENDNALLPMPSIAGQPEGSSMEASLLRPLQSPNSNTSGYFTTHSGTTSLNPSTSPSTRQNSVSPLASPINDPNFDPPYPNDVRIPVRKGWDNTLHFIMKHSDGLTKATKSYVTSHLEFGGCLADYAGLKKRYARIRALEDVDDERHQASSHLSRPLRRIRFVNYYTASTGRTEKAKLSLDYQGAKRSPVHGIESTGSSPRMQHMGLTTVGSQDDDRPSQPSTPPFAEQELDGDSGDILGRDSQEMDHMEPIPFIDDEDVRTESFHDPPSDKKASSPMPIISPDMTGINASDRVQRISLPPIPPIPTEPLAFDPSSYTDKDERKLAEKEYSRKMKLYQRAVKDRDKAIVDRRKLVEKREKKARQAREKQIKDDGKLRIKEEKGKAKLQAKPDHLMSATPGCPTVKTTPADERVEKPKRDRKFCMLPPKAGTNGERDKCWSRVFMEGVDEVGAHCGLFIAENAHYEKLVADVGNRIHDWVLEAFPISEGVGRSI